MNFPQLVPSSHSRFLPVPHNLQVGTDVEVEYARQNLVKDAELPLPPIIDPYTAWLLSSTMRLPPLMATTLQDIPRMSVAVFAQAYMPQAIHFGLKGQPLDVGINLAHFERMRGLLSAEHVFNGLREPFFEMRLPYSLKEVILCIHWVSYSSVEFHRMIPLTYTGEGKNHLVTTHYILWCLIYYIKQFVKICSETACAPGADRRWVFAPDGKLRYEQLRLISMYRVSEDTFCVELKSQIVDSLECWKR
ncbi:uncharacterized protein LAESUDRAFT_814690 [Laetiporus sulphureus 93-53]|uniref:Uncharacterized protein n=1 Tax=Laetiporus sulphureus 93-53 TaxID=1314785 RepID=A0A165CT24_9APHY|nr:uncharacterized protein LAESUDRAFT_814690 [Laetiporus sulphureus 93-53]KZT03388.1 hypothetical protein LAESUDRAFT_814690 [Laetiporus sulphureus 93-53]